MFEATLENCLLLRKAVDTAKVLTDNVSFRVDARGLRFSSMDFTKSVIVDFFLECSFFKDFKCDTEEHSFTMRTDSLMNVLKTSASDETCRIQMSTPSSDYVSIVFVNPGTGKTRKTTTRLEENPEEPVGIPQRVEYSAVIELKSMDFQKEISNFHIFDDLNVKTSNNGVILSGRNEKQGFSTEWTSADQDSNSTINFLDVKENTNSDFSRKFMEIFSHAAPISDIVELRIWEFICVKYSIGDGGFLKFYLAAKIKDEGMDEMDD